MIGGIDQEVTEAILHAAFIPFGEIVAVQLSPDNSRSKKTPSFEFAFFFSLRLTNVLFNYLIASNNTHKGFGFVEFELPGDCEAAIDNMHLAELNGKVIKVQLAKPHNITATSHRAGKIYIWNVHIRFLLTHKVNSLDRGILVTKVC
jgi:peptidyl-prolyl isomerase E (cyclophilin E)